MKTDRLARACLSLPAAFLSVLDGDAIVDWAARIQQTDRWTSFDAYHRTTATLVELLTAGGVAHEVYPVPTGTRLGSGRWNVSEAADVVAATIELVAPGAERLADYESDPWLVARWSGATPAGGLTLTLTVCDDLATRDRHGPGGFAGQVVLTKAGLGGQAHAWAEAGAPVVLFESDVTGHPDARTWAGFGWGGTPFSHGAARPVGLSISRRLGQRLRRLAAKAPVTLRVEVDTRHYVGTHDLVSGLVRGVGDPSEELWVLAHSQEPGALDNASGVAIGVAIARAIEALIAAATLRRPKRTIRILSGFECYGFFHFAEHVRRLSPPVAGVCLDTLGARPTICGRRVGWHATLPMSAQFVNLVGEAFLRAALRLENPGYRLVLEPFMPTSDTLLGDPRYGFPCPWLETYRRGDRAYHEYHTSADTPDILDPRGLRTLAAAMAGYLYYLADAGTTDAVELARRTAGSLLAELPDELTAARAAYARDQLEADLGRLRRLMWAGDRRAALAAMDAERQRLETRLAKAAPSRRRPRDRRVPRRTAFLSPTLENSPAEFGARFHRAGLPPWALCWADGRRDLATIRERLCVELGRDVKPADVAEYFAAHEAFDYCEIIAPERVVTRSRLVRELRAVGLSAGLDVMVHSSLSALGHIEGGAETVIDAILQAVGSRGTVLMPSFNHGMIDVYCPLSTPTTNGAVAQAFWQRAEAARSDHATHAVAGIGPKAEAWCDGHLTAGIWTADSPIGRLIHSGGWLLLLGVGPTVATAYHVGEVEHGAPCLDCFAFETRAVTSDGGITTVPGRMWRDGDCPVSPSKLEPLLRERGQVREGPVGEGTAQLVRAMDVLRARRDLLGETCAGCAIRPAFLRMRP